MKNFWGGFMKKRISCKTIKSKLLCDDFVSQVEVRPFNFQKSSFILNNNDAFLPGAAIYTRNLNLINIQTDDYLTEESLDFFA